jgi:hypothetical protein
MNSELKKATLSAEKTPNKRSLTFTTFKTPQRDIYLNDSPNAKMESHPTGAPKSIDRKRSDSDFIYPCQAFRLLLIAIKENDAEEIERLCKSSYLLEYLSY